MKSARNFKYRPLKNQSAAVEASPLKYRSILISYQYVVDILFDALE